jgi:hemerythrin-like domain-containing protein
MLLKIGHRPDHDFREPLGLLSDCHRRIEHFLAVLTTIANQARGATLTDAQRAQLDAAATYFVTAAPRHTADEEDSLFPRLRLSNDPQAAAALALVDRLEDDHAAATEQHEVVDRLVRRWLADGNLTAADVEQLLERLGQLTTMYAAHIAVEDHQVFPAAAEILSKDDIREIGQEMMARRSSRAGV